MVALMLIYDAEVFFFFLKCNEKNFKDLGEKFSNFIARKFKIWKNSKGVGEVLVGHWEQ